MYSSTWNAALAQVEDQQESDQLSLDAAFEHVADGRRQRGRRYEVALVLSLLVLGKRAGMTTLAASADGVRWRADWLSQVVPTTRRQVPCATTYGNVLRAGEADQVTQAIAVWLTRLEAQRRCGEEPSRLRTQPEARERHAHLALDGKTLRGTLGHADPEQRGQHGVALSETQTGVVLAQQAVPDKGNEIRVEATLLTPALVQGRSVSADALHTQRACCAQITQGGGD